MAKTKPEAKILVNGIDMTPVFRNASITIDRGLRDDLSQTRKALTRLERVQKAFDDNLKDLKASQTESSCGVPGMYSQFCARILMAPGLWRATQIF